MALQEHVVRSYTDILKEELLVAMGCTEPIAIAYAAAILRRTLDTVPQKISAKFSGNIIKNVKSVIVPATGGLHGLEAAISAGVVAACPERVLEVLTVLTPDDQPSIRSFLESCDFSIREMDTVHAFDLELTGVAIGPVALVSFPGEPFTDVGVQTKDTPGWKAILPCALTNGYQGYFPMRSAFDEGGYEARASNYVAGVAETLIDGAKELLGKL